MIDTSVETIKGLFFEQVRDLTAKTNKRVDTFDFQFSDRWLGWS